MENFHFLIDRLGNLNPNETVASEVIEKFKLPPAAVV
jgi:hypothetical protein